ncbi:HD domain-containing protein [Flindersiella endophytica]
MTRAEWAEQTARNLLANPLPQRWAHSQGVAARARTLAPILGENADLVEAAAWLHDIGYAPWLVEVDFHPLDGARYLRDSEQADGLLCGLVAYHSCAINEAHERGLDKELLAEFQLPPRDLEKALIYCDMTANPTGQPVTVEERIADIYTRYGDDHPVTRAIRRSEPWLVGATHAINRQLAESER